MSKLKGLIISKYDDMIGSYVCERLIEEAKKQDIELDCFGIYDNFLVKDSDLMSSPVDFVINRYKYGYLKDEVNGYGKKSYNNLAAFNKYVNKYQQVKNVKCDILRTPKYLLGTLSLSYQAISEKLGESFVVKGLESSEGLEIFLVQSENDYWKLRRLFLPDKDFLFEEFIDSSFGKDIRLFSIRGEAVAAMERSSKGDFRSNFALGGSVKKVEINDDLRQIATTIYNQTGLDFIGIDLLYGKDSLYFCEINVMPGFKGLEQATGVNIAEKAIELIRGDFGQLPRS